MRNCYKRLSLLFVLFIFVLALSCFTVNNVVFAYGNTYTLTTAQNVKDFLVELRNYTYYYDDIIIKGTQDTGTQDIDMGEYYHSSFSFSDIERYPGKSGVVNIYFDVGLTNIFRNDGECSGQTHYGLFSDVENKSISVYYKVNFDVGEGTLTNGYKYYQYGYGNAMPTVTAPEGKTFLGWVEEGTETIVDKIGVTTWGVKTYVATYEDTTPSEPDDSGNEETPTNYPIVYSDSLGASGIDSLTQTYTVGESLTLGTLEKEGFVFKGWRAGESEITALEDTLQEGLLSEDGKIYLTAVWELKDISLGALNGVSRAYNGNISTIDVEVNHTLKDSLTFAYEWYTASTEEEKLNPTSYATTTEISFKNVVGSAYYMVKVTATHEASGLTTIGSSDWTSVEITKAPLTINKIDGDYGFNKVYDGTNSSDETLEEGKHFSLEGVVEGESVGAIVKSQNYSGVTAGEAELVVVVGVDGDESILSNYSFADGEFRYSASISKKAVSLVKIGSPTITKVYDGNDEVDYSFTSGVDYALEGVVGEITHTATAKYTDVNVGENKVVALVVAISDGNHELVRDRLEYGAVISKATLTFEKSSSPTLSKTYDGDTTVDYTFEYGVDFVAVGAVDGEISAVTFSANYDRKDVSATKVILIPFEITIIDGATMDNYDYLAGSVDIYFDGTILPKTIEVSGANLSREYEETENLFEIVKTGVGEEEIRIKLVRQLGNNVGKYYFTGAEFTAPVNANYSLQFVDKGYYYEIVKSVPTLAFPTFLEIEYSPEITLSDLTLSDDVTFTKEGENFVCKYGTFSWSDSTLVPEVASAEGYEMIFIPNDLANYDYTSQEGYDATEKWVVIRLALSVLQATPTAPELDENYLVPVGMRYNKVALPSGWEIDETSEITPASIASGEAGGSYVFERALVYKKDETNNYKTLYADFSVYFVATEIIYTYSSEISRLGYFVTIVRNLNEDVKLKLELINPFEKTGYQVEKWVLPSGEEVSPSQVESGYFLTDQSLIDMTLTIEVVLQARDDIKVEFRHYYENQSNSFDEENVVVEEILGTAGASVLIDEGMLKNKKGFTFKESKIGNEGVESYLVAPDGSTVVSFYYERKVILVKYVDDNYSELLPEGELPSSKEIKFGVPFNLDQPLNYLILGYDFVGYTDGITYDGEQLKIITDMRYVVTEEVDEITFNVNYRPSENVAYKVYRYVDGVPDIIDGYGKVGDIVSLDSLEYLGHERVSDANEKLTGFITAHLLNDKGEVIKGEMLVLRVYYVTLSYEITMPEELGGEIEEIKYGESFTLPEAPENQEEEFLGWLINGQLYAPGETIVMPATNLSITAKWQEKAPEMAEADGEEAEKVALSAGAIIGTIAGACVLLIVAGVVSAVVGKRQKSREQLISKLKEVNNNMFKKK